VKQAGFWKEQRKHFAYVWLVARQLHVHCTINQLGTGRALVIVFSAMIFKAGFFYISSLDPLRPLNGLHRNAAVRLCPLFSVSCAPAVCVFGDLVPCDEIARTTSIRALKHNSSTSTLSADGSNPKTPKFHKNIFSYDIQIS